MEEIVITLVTDIMDLQEGATEVEDPEVEAAIFSTIDQKVHHLNCQKFCLLYKMIEIKFKTNMIAMFIDREDYEVATIREDTAEDFVEVILVVT